MFFQKSRFHILSFMMVSLISSLFTGYSFATDITKCPSINTIKMEGVTKAEHIWGPKSNYFASNESSYDTEQIWKIEVSEIAGNSVEDAINKGNKIIQTIYGDPEPDFIVCKRHDKCIAKCKYDEPSHYKFVIATTNDYSIK